MKRVIKTLLLATVITTGSLVFAFYLNAQKTASQPIAYNHKLHIEQGLGCLDCHIFAEDRASATLPSLDVCSECHSDEPMTDSEEELVLIRYIENEEEIPWKKIYSVPQHVYFSHRRHVIIGEMDCETCHGNVVEKTSPITEPFLEMNMKKCMECHKENKVTNDCLSCHY